MAKVSRESAPRRDDHGVVEDLAGELEGYTVNFVTLREDIDGRALLKGLPDDAASARTGATSPRAG